MIEFDKDCGWDNFMSPNYTALLLHEQQRPSSALGGATWLGFRGE